MTKTQTGEIQIPGYVAGTWAIDPVHSEVGFSVRHMMVSKVRGKFAKFGGELVTADDVLASSVTAEIDLASIETTPNFVFITPNLFDDGHDGDGTGAAGKRCVTGQPGGLTSSDQFLKT